MSLIKSSLMEIGRVIPEKKIFFISQYIFIMSPSNIDPSKREWPFKCLDLWSQRAAIVLDLNVIEGKAFILI